MRNDCRIVGRFGQRVEEIVFYIYFAGTPQDRLLDIWVSIKTRSQSNEPFSNYVLKQNKSYDEVHAFPAFNKRS